MNYQKLSKHAMGCMYVGEVIKCVIVSALLAGAHYILENGVIDDVTAPDWVLFLILLLIPVNVVVSLISPIIRFARYRYILTEEELEVRQGILVITREIVPIERVQKIEVSAGPIDRAFHLAKVKVVTAGAEVTARFLENGKAEQIAETLKQRINRIVVENREKQDGAE